MKLFGVVCVAPIQIKVKMPLHTMKVRAEALEFLATLQALFVSGNG